MKLSVHDHSYMRVKMYKKIIHVREKLGVVFAVMDTKAWQVIQAHIIRHYIKISEKSNGSQTNGCTCLDTSNRLGWQSLQNFL